MFHKPLLVILALSSSVILASNQPQPFSHGQNVGAKQNFSLQNIGQQTGLWLNTRNRYQSFSASRSPLSSGCQKINISWQGVNHRQPIFCRQDTALLQTLAPLAATSFSNNGDSPNESLANRASLISEYQASSSSFVALDTASDQQTKLQAYYADDTWGIGVNIINDAGYKRQSDKNSEHIQLDARQNFGSVSLQHQLQLMHHKQEIAGLVSEAFATGDKKAYQVDSNRRFNPNDNSQQQGESLLASTLITLNVSDNKTLMLQPYLTLENFEQQDQQHFAGIDWQQHKQSFGLLGSFTRPALNNSMLVTGFSMDYSQGQLQQQGLDNPSLKQLDYRLSSVQLASFMQLQSQLSSTWQSDIGLRLENSRYHYHNKLDNGAICDNFGNCPFARLADDKQSFFHIAPMAEIRWQYLPSHQTFWRFDKRSRAPSNQQLYQSQQGITPSSLQEIASYTVEWGFKGSADNFTYSLVSYAQRNHGLIVETANSQQFQNQKSLRLGAQLQIHWQLYKAWQLSLVSDIANERYATTPKALNIKNQRVAMAPTQTHQLQLQWQASNQSLVQFNWRFIDNYYLDAEHSALYSGHQLLDARFEQNLSQALGFYVGVENIGDEHYANYAELSDQATAGEYLPQYDVGHGRIVRFGVNYQFK